MNGENTPSLVSSTNINNISNTPISTSHKTAIIIPFRDLDDTEKKRTKQLEQFVEYMKSYLGGYTYKIFIIEQTDDAHKFNRGQLLNIGFKMAEKEGFDIFIFHDVDLLPSAELKQYYITPPTTKPVHIASVWDRYGANPKYFGGITAFNRNMFIKINGYPNNFWGWGGEDDELYKRTTKFYKIERVKNGSITDLENMDITEKLDYLRENDLKFMFKREALATHEKTWKKNGLTSLKYQIIDKSACGLNCKRILVDLDKSGGVRIITSITSVPAHVLGTSSAIPNKPTQQNDTLNNINNVSNENETIIGNIIPEPSPNDKIINNYEDAIRFASKYINNSIPPLFDIAIKQIHKNVPKQYRKLPPNVDASIWKMSIDALKNTLSYILEYLNHSCYMMCVNGGKGYISKLDRKKTADVYRPAIQKAIDIDIDANPTINARQKKMIKERLRTKGELRFMQCIVKEHAPEKQTVSNEYDDFIENINLPDGVYILNLTDAVILRKDWTHPFPMVVGDGVHIGKYANHPFIPIFSISGQNGYYDIPIPNYDDIMYGLGHTNINMDEFETDWTKKKPVAVFRGGPTGCGYTTETNQRLKLATIAKDAGEILDVQISGKGVSINTGSIRYDPVYGIGMLNVKGIAPAVNFLPMAKQSEYKYIIHVDGNVNAYRLLTSMATGSVILRVESEYTSWVDHILMPYVHYIPIKSDLSDLMEQIEKCVKNDTKMADIAMNGMQFARGVLSLNILRGIFQNIIFGTMHRIIHGTPITTPISNNSLTKKNIPPSTTLYRTKTVKAFTPTTTPTLDNKKEYKEEKIEAKPANNDLVNTDKMESSPELNGTVMSLPVSAKRCPVGSRKIFIDGIAKCKKGAKTRKVKTPSPTNTEQPTTSVSSSVSTNTPSATPKTASLISVMSMPTNIKCPTGTRKIMVDGVAKCNKTRKTISSVNTNKKTEVDELNVNTSSPNVSIAPIQQPITQFIELPPILQKERNENAIIENREKFPWLRNKYNLHELVLRIQNEIPTKSVIDDHRVTFTLADDTPSLVTRAIQEEEILKTHLKHKMPNGTIVNMPSFWDVWKSNPNLETEINKSKDPHEAVWKLAKKYNYKLATTFMPSYAKALYDTFQSKKVLDPCTGWGDRMLGASCSSSVIKYVGFDPNKNLRAGYAETMGLRGVGIKKVDDTHLYFDNGFEIHSQPFEEGARELENSTFDFAFTSPPFFDYEMYNPDNPEYTDWITQFYIPLFKETCRVLKDGHYFGIHIGDTTAGKISDFLHKQVHRISGFILDFKIGLMGVWSGKNRTVYMYRKVSNTAPVSPEFFPFPTPKYKSQPADFPNENIEKILNPPILVQKVNDGGRKFNLVQDAQCIGGTKQRLLCYLLGYVDQPEIVYAGPEQGMAQVALALSCALWGKKATVFLNTSINTANTNMPVLTRLAQSLGANIEFSNSAKGRTLKQTEEDARKYCESNNRNRFLVPFGLKDEPASVLFDTFKNALIKSIGNMDAPNRMWVVAGSAFLVSVLSAIWPNTEFHIVQVGKTVYADQLIAIKHVLYKSEFRFAENTDELPPYLSIPWYDAKLWKLVKQYGKDGDHIWNVGGVPTENEINWIDTKYKTSGQFTIDQIAGKIQNMRIRAIKNS